MAYKTLIIALSIIAAASPATAGQPEPGLQVGAPEAPAGAKYCLRLEPITGTRIESIRCDTREGWALMEIDVDKEWAKEGVRVIG